MTESVSFLLSGTVFPWLALAVGLCVGSFLNVVIHRLPVMMEREWEAQCQELRGEPAAILPRFNIVVPGSRCPACGHKLRAWENIPIVSWLLLRGRCSACSARISARYPVVELLGGLTAAWCAVRFGPGLAGIAAMVFVWAMIAASFIDFDTQLLPDAISLPLLWLGLLVNIPGTFADLRSAVFGAVAGYLILWLVYWAFKLATGKEGMGFGDFKLLAAIGAWTGWAMLPFTILASSVFGALIGLTLILLAGRGRNVPIPFGPYLACAGVAALFWGPQISNYYLRQVL
jgi:leader peptidase (prepilin peptidase)/N-methyltransferase